MKYVHSGKGGVMKDKFEAYWSELMEQEIEVGTGIWHKRKNVYLPSCLADFKRIIYYLWLEAEQLRKKEE
jgi:hypothetical protein